MKVTIDSSVVDDLTTRLYLAAVIGPSRRPNGKAQQVVVQVSGRTVIATNGTPDRAMFVNVILISAGQVIQFSNEAGLLYPINPGAAPGGNFTLRPGESLYAGATTAAATLNVFTETF